MEALCADLDVNPSVFYRWRKTCTSKGQLTEAAAEQERTQRLHLKIAELKRENEMLEQAVAYFAKDRK